MHCVLGIQPFLGKTPLGDARIPAPPPPASPATPPPPPVCDVREWERERYVVLNIFTIRMYLIRMNSPYYIVSTVSLLHYLPYPYVILYWVFSMIFALTNQCERVDARNSIVFHVDASWGLLLEEVEEFSLKNQMVEDTLIPWFFNCFLFLFDGLEQEGCSLMSWCSSRIHPSRDDGHGKYGIPSMRHPTLQSWFLRSLCHPYPY